MIDMIKKYINDYDNMVGKPQVGDDTFYPKRTPKESELDIDKSIISQFNLLRVVDNERYPAYFHINNKKYIRIITSIYVFYVILNKIYII